MKIINKYLVAILLSPLLSTSSVFSFEVNTHQAITRCALTKECGEQGGAKNLNYFIISALLDLENYTEEPVADFGLYGKSYLNYATKGEEVFKEFNIDFNSGSDVFNLIEAGVVLEDAIYHNALPLPGLKKADGRFNNHFYMAQKDIEHSEPDPTDPTTDPFGTGTINILRLTERALYADGPLDAYGKRTDNISWALQEGVSVGTDRENDYTIHKAFEYYKKSFKGSAKDRKDNQAHLFASMGFLIHLLQDLHSPAHVRNGPHAGGDYLEIYGRYDNGFNLLRGVMNAANDPSITAAMSAIDVNTVMLIDNIYSSYQDFFTGEALWTSKNFFSEAHDLISPFNIDGIGFNNDTCHDKNSTIFDARNDNLSIYQTDTHPVYDAEKNHLGEDKWFYITNPEADGTITGPRVVALHEKGYFIKNCYSMAAVTAPGRPLFSNWVYSEYNKDPLSSTATNVMPRAMASSQAFINYFFRARMEAYINYEDANGEKILDTISIKNVSEPLLVSSEELLTFKAGTKLTVSYRTGEDENEVITEIKTVTLPEDLLVDEEFEIIGLKELFASKGVDIQNGDKVLILLDGQVGEKQGLDEYNIEARGLAVAYAMEPKVLIKKTGAGSYSSFDDGYYQKGVVLGYAQFSGADYVFDRVTKLYWHDPAEIPVLNFQAAIDYCNNLNYQNIQWRLPKTREVLSLYDAHRYASPTFKDDKRKLRTNRSKYVDSLGSGTSVLTLHHSGVLFADDSDEISTRCVVDLGLRVNKEQTGSILVRDDTKGIVRDRSTGLIWQDNIDFTNSSSPRTYEENLNYCESLSLGGYNDWRLPNENELFSLVGESALNSGVLAPFQTNNSGSFFAVSSTPKTDNTRSMVSVVSGHAQRAWLIRVLQCYGCGYADPWKGYSRCVR